MSASPTPMELPPSPRYPYEGTYRQSGKTLTRISDDHQLLVCHTVASGPTRSPVYLVDASSPVRPFVSSIYGDEFEHRRVRYRIVRVDASTVEIRFLYECHPKPARRSRGLPDARSH